MDLKKKHEILYLLGRYYDEINRKKDVDFLNIALSKVELIDMIVKSKIVEKKERAIYKNLEDLEKMKYIEYKNNLLRFSKKGAVAYKRVKENVDIFVNIDTNISKNIKKGQMTFVK